MTCSTNTTTREIDFESRVAPYVDSLYSTALRMTRNAEDAEDIVQETFIKAFRYMDKFQEGTNFKAWIFKILRNTFINEYRRRKGKPMKVDLSEVPESKSEAVLACSLPNPEDACLDRVFDGDIRKALDGLPEEYRLVVILVDVQDFTYREVAEIFDMPMGTVMSRLYRGRRMLEEALLEYARRRGYMREGVPSRLRNKDLLADCA